MSCLLCSLLSLDSLIIVVIDFNASQPVKLHNDDEEAPTTIDRITATSRFIFTQTFGNKMEVAKVSVPAIVYAIQNNLLFLALSHLEAPLFQVYQPHLHLAMYHGNGGMDISISIGSISM
jgi:hypothetical protein